VATVRAFARQIVPAERHHREAGLSRLAIRFSNSIEMGEDLEYVQRYWYSGKWDGVVVS
jgi:hypothetical protein